MASHALVPQWRVGCPTQGVEGGGVRDFCRAGGGGGYPSGPDRGYHPPSFFESIEKRIPSLNPQEPVPSFMQLTGGSPLSHCETGGVGVPLFWIRGGGGGYPSGPDRGDYPPWSLLPKTGLPSAFHRKPRSYECSDGGGGPPSPWLGGGGLSC